MASNELIRPKQNRFEKAYTRFAERQNKALLAKLINTQTLGPRLTLSTAFGIGYALLVHLVTLGLLISGVLLIVTGWPNFIAIGLGALSLGVFWFVRPKVNRWPQKQVLARLEYPALYNLADQVADALHVRRVDGLVIDKEINASFGRYGLRRRSLLTLGLPLWAILDDQEKVGLIAHEFAHHANGDFTRHWLIGSAIQTLNRWYILFLPPRQRIKGRRYAAGDMLSVLLLYALSRITLCAWFVMRHLFAQNSRRAEYLADYLASTISGTEAIAGVMRRLQMTDVLAILLNRLNATGKRDVELLNSFRERVRSVTDLDLQRIKQDDQSNVQRLDITHPPLSYRLELLNAHPVTLSPIVLSQSQNAQIDQELSKQRERIQKQLLQI